MWRAKKKKTRSKKTPKQIAMEKTWITDKFYSHFPSYTDQSARRREILAESRRQEYQNYLKQMSVSHVTANRRRINDQQLIKKFNHIRAYDDIDDEEGIENQSPVKVITTRAIIETTSSVNGGEFICRCIHATCNIIH